LSHAAEFRRWSFLAGGTLLYRAEMNRVLVSAIAGTAAASLALIGVPTAAHAAANNLIKVDKSINKVKVGNTQAKVINKMGVQPKSIETGVNDFGPYKILHFKHKFDVTIIKGRGVTNMTTTSGKQRTVDGIGVGSTKAELRGAYAVTCEKVPGSPGKQICLTGELVPGEILTDFRLTNKVVTMVGVGVVVD
jgi:hypothetical protein